MTWHQPQMQLPGQQPQGVQPQPGMAGAVPQYYGPQVPVNGQYPQQPQQGQPQQVQTPPPGMPTYGLPQPPQPQHQPAPVQGFQGSEVLDGPGVPTELRGRKLSDVMNIYGRLMQHYEKTQGQGGQPQQQGNQPAPVGQQQPNGQQRGGQQLPPPNTAQGTPFQQAMRAMVREAVGEAVAPITQHTVAQQAQQVQAQMAQRIPDFQQIQHELRPIIEGAAPENLTKPEFWESAADLARGRMYRNQQFGQQAPQPHYVQQPSQQPQQNGWQPQPTPVTSPNSWPGQPQSQYGFPQPQTQMPYFTEGPTPPTMGSAPMQFSPTEQEAMQAMGIKPDEWAAWKTPVQMGSRQPQRRF